MACGADPVAIDDEEGLSPSWSWLWRSQSLHFAGRVAERSSQARSVLHCHCFEDASFVGDAVLGGVRGLLEAEVALDLGLRGVAREAREVGEREAGVLALL